MSCSGPKNLGFPALASPYLPIYDPALDIGQCLSNLFSRAKGNGVIYRPVPVRRVFPLKKMSVAAQRPTPVEHWPRSVPDNLVQSEHIDLREDARGLIPVNP